MYMLHVYMHIIYTPIPCLLILITLAISDEPRKRVSGGCPNRYNPHHKCNAYCIDKYGAEVSSMCIRILYNYLQYSIYAFYILNKQDSQKQDRQNIYFFYIWYSLPTSPYKFTAFVDMRISPLGVYRS